MEREVELVRSTKLMSPDEERSVTRMAVVGIRGAVSFSFFATMPEVVLHITKQEMPWGIDLSYHSRTPCRPYHVLNEEAVSQSADFVVGPRSDCDLLNGGPCWTDGSSMRGDTVGQILREQGEDAVWEYLADYYHAHFYAEVGQDTLGFADYLKLISELL